MNVLSTSLPVGSSVALVQSDSSPMQVTSEAAGGGGGGGDPLTRDFYVDPGRIGSTEDGSIGNPFLTAVAAIAACAALVGVRGAVLLADGDYTAEDIAITSRMSVRAIGEGRGSALFNSISIGNGASLVQMTNVASLATTVENAVLEAYDCETLGACTLNSSGGGSGILRLFNSDATLLTFTDTNQGIVLERSTVSAIAGGANAGSVVLTNSTVTGDVDCTDLVATTSVMGGINGLGSATLQGCRCTQIVMPGICTVDTFTLASIRLSFNAPNTIGTLIVTDPPLTTGITFTVGALTATFADVTAALPGCRPGDTFDVATTTRLADVGIVDAFCDVADVLTLRFFGTTAGGDVVCNVNYNPNS